MLNHGEEFRNHRYEGATRVGIVIERRTGKSGPQVRLQYPDRRVASAWTPIAQRNTVGSKDYNLPELGERVLVLHLANGPERGVVVGCIFNESVSAMPQGNPDNRQVTFRDGTVVEYDPGAKAMKINAAGSMSITAASPLTITAPEVTLTGPMRITGNVEIVGNLKVEGDIENTGDMRTEGEHRDRNGLHSGGREREEDQS